MITRLLKQKFRWKQLFNRLRYEFSPKKRQISHGPIWLSIYPTRRCTYACSFCTNHATNGAGNVKEAYQLDNKDMSYETFKKIIDRFDSAMVCTFCGVGEPLLVGDIFRMIKYANKGKMITELVTNGSLMNKKVIEEIVESRLQRINISLNESDQELHRQSVNTKKAYLPQIKESIRQLVEKKKKDKLDLEIKISRVLTASTLARAREFIETGIELGVDKVVFHNLIYSGIDEYDLREILFDTDKNKTFLNELRDEYSDRITVESPVLIKKDGTKPNCKWFWKNISIDGSGNLGSCGRFFTPSHAYGKYDQENVWNSEYFTDMRERFLNNNLLDYCKYCVENSDEK